MYTPLISHSLIAYNHHPDLSYYIQKTKVSLLGQRESNTLELRTWTCPHRLHSYHLQGLRHILSDHHLHLLRAVQTRTSSPQPWLPAKQTALIIRFTVKYACLSAHALLNQGLVVCHDVIVTLGGEEVIGHDTSKLQWTQCHSVGEYYQNSVTLRGG